MNRRQKKIAKVFLVICVLCFLLLYSLGFNSSVSSAAEPGIKIVTYPNVHFKAKDSKRILLWTDFFHTKWAPEQFINCLSKCPAKCTVTDDKNEFRDVDAVSFHLTDLWPQNWVIGTKQLIEMPKYRSPDQVWTISNMEPPPHLFGDIRVLNGMFNVTMWYRMDSDVPLFYGNPKLLNKMEMSKALARENGRNYFTEKTNGVSLRISNCFDPGRRYKVIGKLEKYLPIDKYGKCYDKVCGNPTDPYDEECSKIMKSYKFYLAFENDNCKDYVTEKYWATLTRDVIPIVNWKNISPKIVIPNSYINIYDFETIQEAAEYIKRVGENETLYNSYFEYKKLYKNHHGKCEMCRLCEHLHNAERPAQFYKDLDGWVKDDSCEKVELWNNFMKNVHGWKYYLLRI